MKPRLDQAVANKVIGSVASAFKQNRLEIIKDAKESGIQSVVYSKILKEDNDFDFAFFGGKISTFMLQEFIQYKKFIKTEVYASYLAGEQICQYLGADNYAYAFSFNKDGKVSTWVVYKTQHYDGAGGVVCKDPNDDNFFVVELLSNFVQRYRVGNIDEDDEVGTELVD